MEGEQVKKKKQIKRGPGFTCLFCNKRFKGTSCEKTHIRRHINEKPYECGLCSFAAACLTDVSTHQRRTHSTLRLTCTVPGCNKVFKCEFARKKHYKLNHTEDVATMNCDICNKGFKQQANLVAHRRIHTGETPFKCQFCEREFSQKSNLTTHLSMHTGDKRTQCFRCLKWFRNKQNMLIHYERNICVSPVKPFTCTICEVGFFQASYLKDHYKLAHGIIRYGRHQAVVINRRGAGRSSRKPTVSSSHGAPPKELSSLVKQEPPATHYDSGNEDKLSGNQKAVETVTNQKLCTGDSTVEAPVPVDQDVVINHTASPSPQSESSSINQKIVVCRSGAAIVTTSKNSNVVNPTEGSQGTAGLGTLRQVKQTLAQGHKTYVVLITKEHTG